MPSYTQRPRCSTNDPNSLSLTGATSSHYRRRVRSSSSPGLLSCECSDMCSPLIVVFNTARQRCAKYQKQSAHLLGSPVLRHRQSAVNVRSGYLIQPCTSVDIDNTMVVLSTQVPLSTTLSFSLFSTRHAVYDTAQERIRTFVSKTKRVPGQTRNPKGG